MTMHDNLIVVLCAVQVRHQLQDMAVGAGVIVMANLTMHMGQCR